MTLWTKETITGDLRDLPAGMQEIRTPEGELCRLPLPESGGRGRSEEIRLCDWATMRLEWYEAEGFHSRHGAEPGFLELSFCLSGRMGWQLRDGGGLYLGPGGLAIRLRESCSDSRLQFPLGYYAGLAFSVDTRTLDAQLPVPLAQMGVTGAGLLERYCPGGRSLALAAQAGVAPLLEPLARLPREARPAWGLLRIQELLLLLGALEQPELSSPEGWPRDQLAAIQAVHARLVEDLSRRYTIEELSREHLLNTSALKAGFKAVYGQPVGAYMRELRMREAARLLRESDLPIAGVAAAVGYENQGKFTRAFKEAVGLLPTEYRRQNGPQRGRQFPGVSRQ